MNNRRPTAVVTGGAGFIGSHLVDLLLAEGWVVRVIDDLSTGREDNLAQHTSKAVRNADLTLDRDDICTLGLDEAVPLFTGVDVVFHLAARADLMASMDNPVEYMEVNVQGTVRVLECARLAGVPRFVYAASSSCYGPLMVGGPVMESHAIAPAHPYALSKYLGEEAVRWWAGIYGMKATSLRIFNAYGPRARSSGYGAVMGVFLRQKLAGKPFTVVGDGSQTRDFVYVTDVARAFLRATDPDRAPGWAFNIGSGQRHSINDLVGMLGGETVHIPWRSREPKHTWADISRAEHLLWWVPKVSFQDGVERILADIEAWRAAPLWGPASIAEATKNWFPETADTG